MFSRVFQLSAVGGTRSVRVLAGVVVGALTATLLHGSVYPRDGAGADGPPAVVTDRTAARGRPVPAKARGADPARAAAAARPAPVTWPAPGVAELDLATSRPVRMGGLTVAAQRLRPVVPAATPRGPGGAADARLVPALAPAGSVDSVKAVGTVDTGAAVDTAAAGGDRLRVEVLDRTVAARAGVDGPVLRLGNTRGPGNARARVTLNYAGFAAAYGGDYGSRLRLLRLPACALEPAAGPGGCGPAEVVPATNNTEARSLTADLDMATADKRGQLFALAAAEDSAQGDYAATKVSPSSHWDVTPSSGGLSWSYPLRTPPVPGGLGPQIALSYSSQAVDGRTAATNNQGSGLGEGFTYEPGYIERRYKPCRDDGHSGVGDQCWARHNATLVLGGRASELVRVNDNEWKLSADDGSKVQRITGAVNGDDDGEHWKVTTADGTQYFLGLGRLPGYSAGKEETGSVWTVPVYGDDAGEPCYRSTFADAHCNQAWRWNLDYVKDAHDNVIAYFYDRETNHYARGGRTDVDGTAYHRAGYLKRIDYGQRHDAVYTTPAPARVHLVVAERCLPAGAIDCDPADLTKATAHAWPDVPYDRYCAPGTRCGIQQGSPTFWTRKRYVEIKTEIRSGGSWSPVDSWALTHLFTDNGDGSRTLWLSKITHTGLVGGRATLPSVDLHGIQLPNRVDRPNDNISPLIRFRLAAVVTDTGAQLDVNYAPADCAANSLPAPGESTRRCYPVKWHPSDSQTEPITDWFHKYVVHQVIETDRVGGSPDMVTRYDYLGPAGWRKTLADGITEAKYLTWSEWRGYERVRTTRGDGQAMTTRTEQVFFRGMDGDPLPGGGHRSAAVADSAGGSHEDAPELTGLLLESLVYNGDNVVSKSITAPWRHTTHTQSETWGTRRSTFTRPASTRALTALASGGWRETRTATTYHDRYGRVNQVEDLGDVSTATDDQCTRSWYAENTGDWIVSRVIRVETVAVACSVTPDRRIQVLNDRRTYYDGRGFGAAPTRGDITKVERLASHTGSVATYAVVSTHTHDPWGRELTSTDATGATTTTDYTDTNGLLTAKKVTNPLGHEGTEEYAPAWGAATVRVDANGQRVDLSYDALGRRSQVWLPDRSKAGGITPSVKYTYHHTADAPVAVRTETVETDGGYEVRFDIYDGHVRLRQTQREGPDGGRLLSDTFYTPTGKTAKVNSAYYAPGPPSAALLNVNDGAVDGQTLYRYDGAERLVAGTVAVAGNERWTTLTTYGGDRVHVDPPVGAVPTTTLLDARDKPVELRQYKGAGPTGDFDRIRYEHTPGGQLAAVTDAAGNVRRYTYDQRGRMVESEDPNAGTTEFGYDEVDRPTWSLDQRGVKVTTTYDPVGRRKNVYLGEPDTGTRLQSWTYDSVYKGQLYASASYVGDDVYGVVYPTRDNFYRPLLTRYVVPQDAGTGLKGVYEFTMSYNRDGTVQGLGLPAAGGLPAEGITYSYDSLERPTGMTGLSTYVTRTQYAQTGALLQAELSTGAKKAWLTWTYEEGTNRLLRSRMDRQDAPAVDVDANYRYDDAGNVLSIADTPAGGDRDVQCFTHDWQRRLAEAWTSASTADDPCAGGPAETGVGGPAPYHRSYGYDAVGNRDRETRHGLGGPDTVRRYTYPDPGRPRPYAVAKVSEADRTFSYEYDDAGNTTVRDLAGQRQVLDWDADGRLASVTEGARKTTFVYDADGNRLVRKEPGATTVYLPGMELRRDNGTGAVAATRYYAFGGKVMAMRVAAGVLFLASDHHGTTHLAIDAVTGSAVRRRSTPFGEFRGVQVSWPGERGFVGGTHDATSGLVHLGFREYDPGIGRFVSTDPIVDPSSPQQLQGYSYANNNPVTLSDPDGRRPCPDGDCSETGRRGGDQSWLHNIVVLLSFAIISYLMKAGGMKGEITIDIGKGGKKRNTIPGAARDGSGDDGVADIIFWGEDVVYVWEVKPGNAGGREMGRQQLDRYIEQLQAELRAKGDHRRVEPGPAFPPVGGIPVGNGKQLRIWTEPGNPRSKGLIFYGTSDAPKGPPPPPGVPVPVDEPVPHPVPTPIPVPGTQRAPQPHGVPNPTPGPCGNGLACPRPGPDYGTDHGRPGPSINPHVVIWGVAIGIVAGICIAATAGVCGVAIGGGAIAATATA